MEEAISAAAASRKFMRILRRVHEGRSYIVTSRGRPVARIVPANRLEIRSSARTALQARLESQAGVNVEGWTRAELHRDGQSE